MRQIDGAKEQWAIDCEAPVGSQVSWTNIIGTKLYLKNMPTCPLGGGYAIGKMGEDPTCTMKDHSLALGPAKHHHH